MKKYEELFLQISRFEEYDVITASDGEKDNVSGACGDWVGWAS